MIVASGRSALTFNAAMSASSASMTIRSAFLLTLNPTVNCQDIFAFRKANLGYERAFSSIAVHSARITNREWGGRWFNGHHMLHGPPHGALHVLALVNNGARISQMAIR
jgi:hypothetical protein